MTVRNFSRPVIATYQAQPLPNYNRYQLLTRSNNRPPTDIMIDTDFNFIIDSMRLLSNDINDINITGIAGAGDPDNKDCVITTNGVAFSWIKIGAVNISDHVITNKQISPGTIRATEIEAGTITTAQVAPEGIESSNIKDLNITEIKLADGSVTETKIADTSVTEAKLHADAVTAPKLAADAVTTDKILDANVTLAKLAADVIARINTMDKLTPIGAIMEFSGTAGLDPDMWKECNGAAVSRATYVTLFANIGITYGPGDGGTTFNLPDRRGRVAVGIGSDNNTGGRITVATADNIGLGGVFGSETHTLTTPEIPSHTHLTSNANGAFEAGGTVSPVPTAGGGSQVVTLPTGGGGAHNNVQPSIFMRYYIRVI